MEVDLKQDLHMHTTFSDGKNTPEEMIISAIGKGLKRIAITDHCPLPFPYEYAMRVDRLEDYISEINGLKENYKGRIEVLVGMEIDYLPDDIEWVKKIASSSLDYRIGSVHHVLIRPLYELSPDEFRSLAREYYNQVSKAAQSGLFDTIGHIDLIKKYNKDAYLFNENEEWYSSLVFNCLDVIKSTGLSLDLNTSGFDVPVGIQYPSDWIIKAATERGIAFVLGSDAHRAENIGRNFDEVVGIIQNL